MSKLFAKIYKNKILGVSGFTRSGKALLMKIISTFENVEKSHTDIMMEQFYYMHKIKKINFNNASYLLRKNFTISLFYNSIGRNINYKKKDFSSIFNYHNPDLYLNRSKSFKEKISTIPKKYLFQIMLHSGLNSSELLMKSLTTLQIIEIYKNPMELVYSWIKKNYGKLNIYEKPNVYILTIKYRDKTLPYYASGWEAKFLRMNKYDKCANMIFRLWDERKRQIKKLTLKQKKRILFISFDNLVTNPKEEIIKISKFLKKKSTKKTFQELKKEKIPRKLYGNEYNIKASFLKKKLSKKFYTKLLKYEDEYLKLFGHEKKIY